MVLMKKLLLIIPALFLFASFLFPKISYAENPCLCAMNESRAYYVLEDNCDSNHHFQCLGSYSNPTAACLCVLNPSSDENQNNPSCGGVSETCCPGNTCDTSELTCTATPAYPGQPYSCLGQAQINLLPGQPPSVNTNPKNAIYCSSSGSQTDVQTNRIYTAIGCIPLDSTNSFLGAILKWAIGIGGGIAFILIIVASFMTMTSAGNPERLKAGQELLVAAISGLILLIFSVFILKVIGIDILQLPGLNL
jgi:hypothetical protein